jgi:hypothetical protein
MPRRYQRCWTRERRRRYDCSFLGRLDELGRRIRVDAGEQKHDLCGSLEPCQGAVEFHMYPRAYHGFYRATKARVTNQAERDNLVALRRFLHE